MMKSGEGHSSQNSPGVRRPVPIAASCPPSGDDRVHHDLASPMSVDSMQSVDLSSPIPRGNGGRGRVPPRGGRTGRDDDGRRRRPPPPAPPTAVSRSADDAEGGGDENDADDRAGVGQFRLSSSVMERAREEILRAERERRESSLPSRVVPLVEAFLPPNKSLAEFEGDVRRLWGKMSCGGAAATATERVCPPADAGAATADGVGVVGGAPPSAAAPPPPAPPAATGRTSITPTISNRKTTQRGDARSDIIPGTGADPPTSFATSAVRESSDLLLASDDDPAAATADEWDACFSPQGAATLQARVAAMATGAPKMYVNPPAFKSRNPGLGEATGTSSSRARRPEQRAVLGVPMA